MLYFQNSVAFFLGILFARYNDTPIFLLDATVFIHFRVTRHRYISRIMENMKMCSAKVQPFLIQRKNIQSGSSALWYSPHANRIYDRFRYCKITRIAFLSKRRVCMKHFTTVIKRFGRTLGKIWKAELWREQSCMIRKGFVFHRSLSNE